MEQPGWIAETRTSYDTVAASYAELLRDSLDKQPVVRHLLALFAELVNAAAGGPVADPVGHAAVALPSHLEIHPAPIAA
ncbi:hypothetical protein OHA72_45950 [Dactylosporangium sp. NBC_01737]|uniref:hypothetical protein n=1 Tax=Dactylosporangium sp. NBC_01737 TaxID=2975959 RepID=UPI002E137A27|nr:hypothetical protein OHA72_45950 [Dactylosporangium sp. NBC_01737]